MIRTYVALLVAVILATAQGAIAASQGGKSPAPSKSAPTNIVNINTAPAAELESLPGVGAKTAERIIEYRQKNGPFKKLEELMNVRGMGEKTFLKLRPQLTVGAPKSENNRPQQ